MGRRPGSKNKTTIAREQAATEPLNSVEEGFEEEMAEETVAPPPGMTPVAALSGDATILQAIREQTEALTRAMPPAKVPFSRFKTRSAFNPTGARRKLKYVVYQNGYRCNPKTLTDEEFALINSGKIRPGQYLSKLVTVRIEQAASEEDQDKIHIGYHNKTPDQRMMLKEHWRGFGDLLRKIVAESETASARRRQHFEDAEAV